MDGSVHEGHGLLSMRQIPRHPGEPGVTWQHLDRADEDGVRAFISTTGFDYNGELLEAALRGPRRARIVEHGAATSFAFLAARRSSGSGGPERSADIEPIAILLTRDYILTVGGAGAIDFTCALSRIRGLAVTAGPGSLRISVLLAVLEQMVSNLEDCASELIIDLNRAEELVFAGPAEGTEASRAIYQYKRELMMLKSAVIPLQQPLKSIIAHQSPGAAGEVIRHFDEVANKLSQVAEQVLYCDDAINSLLQANLAQIDVAQNSDMRRIAAVGAILAGWGLIVGVYQMTQDFETLHKTYAAPLFAATVAVGVAASGVLVVLFRRIRWL